MEHLKGLANLTWIDLNKNTQITDDALQHLKGLTNLFSLRLINTQITDAGLDHLKGMTSLRSLYFLNTQVTDAGKMKLEAVLSDCGIEVSSTNRPVAGNTPTKSQEFAVDAIKDPEPAPDAPITSPTAQADAVAEIENLGGSVRVARTSDEIIFVSLDDTQIADAGLECLKGLTSLRALHLVNTQITDEGLVHLKEMIGLSFLSLDRTQITDAGLKSLKGLTRLGSLDLSDTHITGAALSLWTQSPFSWTATWGSAAPGRHVFSAARSSWAFTVRWAANICNGKYDANVASWAQPGAWGVAMNALS